jgi:hypothetical protein
MVVTGAAAYEVTPPNAWCGGLRGGQRSSDDPGPSIFSWARATLILSPQDLRASGGTSGSAYCRCGHGVGCF